ncbi:MAG: ribosome recycling factor [Verrucomicrobiae bacterium]|nr:ribosome recycling factor [Verrucomicrobiae bacterium]MCP5533635.1 ribosome recycling factor [Akkermansiaceae bacterium]MCP5545084.1 ribosome recycling factor [Akkermansiaceae bacterium]MCP5549161.1 ribosome recycling factor [Akkermansiaceae bacterium]
MDPDETILETEDAMNKCVEYLIHEFASVRTGKASPALIENLDVHVPSYGTTSKLKGLAVISVPEPRMLMVQPFDPSTTRDIERAIRESKLGLNPAAADRSLRVPIPELSEERRREMVKLIKQLAEEAKVRLRAARKDGMDAAKKMKAENIVNEDQQKDLESEIQDLTNKYTKKVDEHAVAKEADLMKV